MAKGNMNEYRREPFSCQTRQEATVNGQPDAELFSLMHDTDPVPLTPHRKSRTAGEDDAPLKSRIALGYLTVNGREEPVYAPIQGFEHLFTNKDAPAPWSPASAQQPRETQTTGSVHRPSSSASSTQLRGVKRRRSARGQNEDNDHDANEKPDPTVAVRVAKTFSVGDIEALKAFYGARFRELTMKPMRDIVTAWVKRLEPRRQQQYGPYQRYKSNSRSDSHPEKTKSVKPPWWPTAVPYVEPSHLKLQHLVPLAVDIMLIHRRIDEAVGKRKCSWITKLETDANYLVTSKDTEHFSSSKGARYNEAMKKRALDIILPSLFDVGRSHEDYIAQYDLYEGSGNEDPGCGKQVSWQPAPRPDRQHAWKRPRPSVKSEPLPEDDDGDETEADEEAVYPSSALSSFSSTFSYGEDVKTFPKVDYDTPPALAIGSTSTQPLHQASTQTSDVALSLDVGQSIDRLHLYEVDTSGALSTFTMDPSTTGVLSQCAGPLSYAYPPLGHDPFSVQGSASFPSSGALAPHDMVLANGTMAHGLSSNDMPIHGLPVHELATTHGLPAHGLPLMTSNWGSSF